MYPHKKTFGAPEDQEAYIREWLATRAGLEQESQALRIVFYSARYHPELGSIFSVGDVPALIPDEDADALILEEPEHLNWCVCACGGCMGGMCIYMYVYATHTRDVQPRHPQHFDPLGRLTSMPPPHPNRYRAPGVPWTKKFQHVVGICHTNYLVYSKSIQGGSMRSAFLFFMNQCVGVVWLRDPSPPRSGPEAMAARNPKPSPHPESQQQTPSLYIFS